ncbi:hypothetical protein JCM8208_007625 [Rhodotorula glutinis]
MADDEGTPDSLFGASHTPAPPSSAAATASSAPPAAGPSFVPRAVKRKPVPARPSAAALLAPSGAPAPPPKPSSPSPLAAAVASASPAPPSAPPKPAEPPKISQQERERLESVLCAVETALSDFGLSVHRGAGGQGGGGGLLERFKEGREALHISQILTLPPVRALTGSQADLQKALRLRDSPIVKIDETGFQIGRKEAPDVQRLEQLEAADWDDTVIYLENIPFSIAAGDSSLTTFLASALSTIPQRVIVPPMFDRAHPLALDPVPAAGGRGAGGGASQADAFRAAQDAQEGRRRARQLPKSGGPFKGFAFVVLPGREEAERVVREWAWAREEKAGAEGAGEGEEEGLGEQGEEAEDAEMGEVEQEGGAGGTGTASDEGKTGKLGCAARARFAGMRALSYDGWLLLKDEYLAYRHSLETLVEAQHEGTLVALRNPPTKRDQPPHLARQNGGARDPPSPSSRRSGKRAASPTSPAFDGDVRLGSTPTTGPSTSSATAVKRPRRAPSPTAVLNQRLKRLRTPSPGLDLSSDAALEVAGAFPAACVLWVRNVHEKSGRTSLKALFGALLETLQEGSGKGVEFVDYEKGLDTCYLRFSSPTLASLVLSHLTSTPSLHLSPTALSPLGALSPSSRTAAESDLRRPLAASLLEGDAERKYWANVPEATRKAARHAAGGTVALLKAPGMGGGERRTEGGRAGGRRGGGRKGRKNEGGAGGPVEAEVQVKEEDVEEEEPVVAEVVEEPQKKRKKPSRL